jgi:hypothetical protein
MSMLKRLMGSNLFIHVMMRDLIDFDALKGVRRIFARPLSVKATRLPLTEFADDYWEQVHEYATTRRRSLLLLCLAQP